MKAKVLIGHFPKGQTQGSQITVGVFVMDVKESMEQVWGHEGCESPELLHEEVKTVTINDRTFIVQPTHFNTLICDYEVYLPYNLAQTIRTTPCPHCGNQIVNAI